MRTFQLAVALFAVVAVFAEEEAEVEAEDLAEDEEEEDENVHYLTDMPEPSPDVICNGVFPKFDGARLPMGEVADVIVGLVNRGQEPMNVTSIAGSINSPFDFGYYIQNFTGQQYNQLVHEDDEITLRYKFMPIDTLDPVDYHISLTVFYENDEELFSTTFFNATVTFYEPESAFGFQQIVKYLGMIGAAAAAVYVGGKAVITALSGSDDDDGEFIKGINSSENRTLRTVATRRRTKKKGNKKRN